MAKLEEGKEQSKVENEEEQVEKTKETKKVGKEERVGVAGGEGSGRGKQCIYASRQRRVLPSRHTQRLLAVVWHP